MASRATFRRILVPALALFGLALAASGGCAQAKNECQFNSDCSNAYCSEGHCQQDCVDSALDCPKGYVCNAIAQCEPEGGGSGGAGGGTTSGPGPTTSGGGTTTSSTSSDVTSSSTTTSTTDTTATTGSGGNGTGHLLDVCGGDGDCASPLFCRAEVVGGTKRCTKACGSNAECPSGTRCESIQGTTYCAASDVGRPCNGPSGCNFGCLTGPGYCTVQCQSGSDCPNGYGCMAISGQNVCVKAEAYCTAQDASACIVPAACDESPTLLVGGCTLTCNSAADCPRRAAGLVPWSCTQGLCKRPSDVLGPLPGGSTPTQYYCNAQQQVVNLCNDAQHIDFQKFTIPQPPPVDCNSGTSQDGVAGDACVDSCRYQGGCPFGFGCTAVGGVNNSRIGLCIPRGGGEVGAPCSNDTQCAFAYCVNGKCSRDCTADGVCPTGSTCVDGGAPGVEGQPFRRCQ